MEQLIETHTHRHTLLQMHFFSGVLIERTVAYAKRWKKSRWKIHQLAIERAEGMNGVN